MRFALKLSSGRRYVNWFCPRPHLKVYLQNNLSLTALCYVRQKLFVLLPKQLECPLLRLEARLDQALERLLAQRVLASRDNAPLVLHQIALLQATHRVVRRTVPHLCLAAHRLLLGTARHVCLHSVVTTALHDIVLHSLVALATHHTRQGRRVRRIAHRHCHCRHCRRTGRGGHSRGSAAHRRRHRLSHRRHRQSALASAHKLTHHVLQRRSTSLHSIFRNSIFFGSWILSLGIRPSSI
jgi:hypothetical protein